MEDGKQFWDDVSGKELKSDLVRAARREEIEFVRKMGVYFVKIFVPRHAVESNNQDEPVKERSSSFGRPGKA